MKKFFKKLWVNFLIMFGDIKIFKFPLFFVYDPDDYDVTGKKTMELIEKLKPGDIVLRGYRNYLDGKFIDLFGISTKYSEIGGDWSHGAIYIGNGKIIHAVAEGVSEINVIDYARCDRICVYRPKKFKTTAIKLAKQFLKDNIPYDFFFKNNGSALYCFELCYKSYPKLNIPVYDIKKLFGLITKKQMVLAKSFIESPDFDLVFCYNPKFKIDI